MTADQSAPPRLRLGIDLGGTKIAGVALASDGTTLAENRMPAPRHDYAATIAAIAAMVRQLEPAGGAATGSVGIGIPGSVSPATGLVQNANSTWLNGRPFTTTWRPTWAAPCVSPTTPTALPCRSQSTEPPKAHTPRSA
jgi:predicted NBD/HSP70 family sugar kinase